MRTTLVAFFVLVLAFTVFMVVPAGAQDGDCGHDLIGQLDTLISQAQDALGTEDTITANTLLVIAHALAGPCVGDTGGAEDSNCSHDLIGQLDTLISQAQDTLDNEDTTTANTLLDVARTLAGPCVGADMPDTAPADLTAMTVAQNDDWTPVIQPFDGVEMVLIPPGCFTMGSTEEGVDLAMELCQEVLGDECQRFWYEDEMPAHEICFDAPLWIDHFEVTNAQFERLGGVAAADNNSRERGDYPRENITLDEATVFCDMRGGRLPTEAEWEYAARGPSGLIFPWGNEFDETVVNHYDEGYYDGYEESAPVGSFPGGISWVGAHDMGGNVVEWVSTMYQIYPFEVDGRYDENRDIHLLRGGGWFSPMADVRTTIRFGTDDPVNGWYEFSGFRCAREYSGPLDVQAPVPSATPEPSPIAPPATTAPTPTDSDAAVEAWYMCPGPDANALQSQACPTSGSQYLVFGFGRDDTEEYQFAVSEDIVITDFTFNMILLGMSDGTTFDVQVILNQAGAANELTRTEFVADNPDSHQTFNETATLGEPVAVTAGDQLVLRVHTDLFGEMVFTGGDDASYIRVGLAAVVPEPEEEAEAPLSPVEWDGSAEFGTFVMTFNEGVGVSHFDFTFADFECGGSVMSGGIAIGDRGWEGVPIIDGAFTFSNPQATMSGVFSEDGTSATGTWEIGECSGRWEAPATIEEDVSGLPPILSPDNITQIELTAVSGGNLYSSDNSLVAIFGNDGTIQIVDGATGEEIVVLDEGPEYSGLEFSADNQVLVRFVYYLTDSAEPPEITVWDMTTGDIRSSWTYDNVDVFGLSPDGSLIATQSDLEMVLWDTITGQEVYRLPANFYTRYSNSLTFNHDGSLLVSTNGDEISLWNVASGQNVWSEVVADMYHLEFSPNGKWILGQGLYSMWLWDMENGRGESYDNVSFSPDGQLIATVQFPWIEIVDAETGENLVRLQTPSGLVQNHLWGLAFSPDSQWLATGVYENELYLWDVATGEQVWQVQVAGHDGQYNYNTNYLTFSPDGDLLVSYGNPENVIEIWDVASGNRLHQLEGSDYMSVRFVLDGRQLTAAGWVWSIPTEETTTVSVASMLGNAYTNTSARTSEGVECAIQEDEMVLAVGYAGENQLVMVYAGGDACEGPVWMTLNQARRIRWETPTEENASVLGLPPVSGPDIAGFQPPLDTMSGAEQLCRNATPYGNAPAQGPPYKLYFHGAGSLSGFPVQLLANQVQDVNVVVCVDTVNTRVQTCSYQGNHFIVRTRPDLEVSLVNAESGQIFAQQLFYGNPPEGCPSQHAFGQSITDYLRGTRGDWHDAWVAWVLGRVEGTAQYRTVVNANAINARSESNTQSEILGQIPYGTPVNLIGRNEDGDWVVALLPDMTKAWLFVDLLRVADQTDISRLPVLSGAAQDVLVSPPE